MPNRFVAALTVACLLVACGGGDAPPAETTRHDDVRGRFLGTASDGRDAVIRHEAIPGVMEAMTMAVPLGDTAAVRRVDVGDPVQFDLVIVGARLRVENLEALPDTVTLDVPEADTTR